MKHLNGLQPKRKTVVRGHPGRTLVALPSLIFFAFFLEIKSQVIVQHRIGRRTFNVGLNKTGKDFNGFIHKTTVAVIDGQFEVRLDSIPHFDFQSIPCFLRVFFRPHRGPRQIKLIPGPEIQEIEIQNFSCNLFRILRPFQSPEQPGFKIQSFRVPRIQRKRTAQKFQGL
ncbi:hypothetical protein ES703_56761 [subsurface metagenome]